jgi:hypothetical protein
VESRRRPIFFAVAADPRLDPPHFPEVCRAGVIALT